MTNILHRTIIPKNHFNPTRFGGIIYPSDYNTDNRGKDNTRGSQIASRIISDKNFDYRCKKNLEKKNSFKSGGSKNA